ncbi:MAG: hypothetical protein EAZ89_20670, partial [Bacteroidetes bacterium]
LSGLNEYCALSFFKGSLLQDAQGLLQKPGENTQAARLIRFTHLEEIIEKEALLKAYITEAVEVEKAGLKAHYKDPGDFDIPEEFQVQLEKDPVLKAAFEALTPGRQRGYILYFSAPKQSQTRAARIEKYIPQILRGIGIHDRYS